MRKIFSISGMSLMTAPVQNESAVSNGPAGYIIGGIIAILILGYLIYTLMKPEKF